MEQMVDPGNNENVGAIRTILEGAKESFLNIGRFGMDIVDYDPHPDATSSLKPGLVSAIRQIKQSRQN